MIPNQQPKLSKRRHDTITSLRFDLFLTFLNLFLLFPYVCVRIEKQVELGLILRISL
jgi:hypothetical protein